MHYSLHYSIYTILEFITFLLNLLELILDIILEKGIETFKNLEGPVAQENYLRNVRLEKLASDYLPVQMTEDEIEIQVHTIIQVLGAETMKDMGKVMGRFNSEFPKGSFDGAVVSKIVKEKLA